MFEALKAAVEERMRLAREATPGPWGAPEEEHDNDGDSGFWVYNGRQGAAEHAICVVPLYDPSASADATHIAANDPAFVLRQCQRDLKVLERHQPGDQDGGGKVCWDHTRRESAPWPCDEIEDLAEVYQINLGVSDDS